MSGAEVMRAAVRRFERPVPGRRLPGALPGARLAARGMPAGARTLAQAERTGTPAQLEAHKRTLVVTFRRDGTPVPTPVWAAPAGGVLYVRSEATSGKVKRLRHDPRVLLAPCTARGVPLGAPLAAYGRVLERPADRERAERTLAARYGRGRELFELAMDVMRVDMCYLELKPQPWP